MHKAPPHPPSVCRQYESYNLGNRTKNKIMKAFSFSEKVNSHVHAQNLIVCPKRMCVYKKKNVYTAVTGII